MLLVHYRFLLFVLLQKLKRLLSKQPVRSDISELKGLSAAGRKERQHDNAFVFVFVSRTGNDYVFSIEKYDIHFEFFVSFHSRYCTISSQKCKFLKVLFLIPPHVAALYDGFDVIAGFAQCLAELFDVGVDGSVVA